jgi:hypothetical protein
MKASEWPVGGGAPFVAIMDDRMMDELRAVVEELGGEESFNRALMRARYARVHPGRLPSGSGQRTNRASHPVSLWTPKDLEDLDYLHYLPSEEWLDQVTPLHDERLAAQSLRLNLVSFQSGQNYKCWVPVQSDWKPEIRRGQRAPIAQNMFPGKLYRGFRGLPASNHARTHHSSRGG